MQFYCLPYVAMSANDLSRDGIDDLSAIVNFSTWYRGTESSRTYTTQQILNHNTHFASVLESYEGTKGGSLRQVIKHRVLVTTPLAGGSASDTGAEHRYILRNANLTVGDVTHEGSQEIIIAGNYTRVNVHNTADNTTNAGGSRLVEVDSNHALCHIVGYTTYDNLKNHNTYDLNSDYHWTVQRDGNKWTYWYNQDSTDSGPITTSLAAFKYQGTGYADTIFVVSSSPMIMKKESLSFYITTTATVSSTTEQTGRRETSALFGLEEPLQATSQKMCSAEKCWYFLSI